MTISNLVGFKEKLKELKGLGLEIESPFVWELPPHFKDEMPTLDLQKIIETKTNEINSFVLEKVAVFLLDMLVRYFLKTLLEQQRLKIEFQECHSRIDAITQKDILPADLNKVKSELHFMVSSTDYAVYWLKGEPYESVPEKPATNSTITALKGWYNMVLYNYAPALQLFDSITDQPEYMPLFAFYHGKTMARERRTRNDRNVTELEMNLLLTASDRHLALPVILSSFENLGTASVLFFKLKSRFYEILQRAWDARDAYHSQNHCRLATIYLRLKNEEKAKELYEMALRLDPWCNMTLHKYGYFLLKNGQQTKGIQYMIKANHLPAFLHLVKSSTVFSNYFPDLPALFDEVELVLTNRTIALPIRYIMYRYSIEHRLTAKAAHHLKVIYSGTKELKFDLAKSEEVRRSIASIVSVSESKIPEEVDIMRECSQFRKVCRQFNDWMTEMEKQQAGYQEFHLTN
jgi:tetratricopeptide (TPR) repeat protein